MIDVDAYVELRDVENGLRRMQLAGRDLRPLFQRVKEDVRADQRDHAKKQAGPSGKWAPRAASTMGKVGHRFLVRNARKTRITQRKRARNLLGRLPRAFTVTYSRSWIRATSRAKWSGAHQPQSLSGSTRVGRGAVLRARPFLWASTGLLATVSRKAVDYMVGAWEKR